MVLNVGDRVQGTGDARLAMKGALGRPRHLWEVLAVVGGFTALTLALTYPVVREMTRALPSDLGDPLLNAWTLAWDADRLAHGLQGFWDAPIFYPYPNTLAYSEHLLGIAVLTAPVQWLSGNAVFTYNVAFLLSYVLAGAGMYLLTASLTGNRLAAVVAAVAFAFLPFRVSHVAHLQVLMYGWMPIGLWALHRFFGSGSRRALATFVVVFLLQGLSNGYYLYFFALPVVAVIAFELWRRPEHRPHRMAQLGVAGAFTLLVLAPVIAAYYQVRTDQQLVRSREDIVRYSADVASYLEGSPALTLWGDTLSSVGQETDLFPGLALPLLAAFGLASVAARGRAGQPGSLSVRPIALLYAGIGTAALVLTLGPEPTAWGQRLLSSGPYDWLLAVVPGLDGLRVPARMAVVVYLALAVLAAVGMVAILTRLSRRLGVTIVVLVSAGVVAEGHRAPMPVLRFEPHLEVADQRAYTWLEAAPPGAVLELPIQGDEPANTLTFQYWTLEHGHPIVNGYSGYISPLFYILKDSSSPLYDLEQFGDLLRACRALGVHYVVVHESRFRQEGLGRATSVAIGRQTDQLQGVVPFGSTTVFWLVAPPDAVNASPPSLRAVSQSFFTATASHANADLDLAFDDNLETLWQSGRQQDGTEWIEMQFDRQRNLGLVQFDMGADVSVTDFPRRVRIESSDDGQEFRELYEGDVLTEFFRGLVEDADRTPIAIILPDNDTVTLRIRQTGQSSQWWSISELSVWEH